MKSEFVLDEQLRDNDGRYAIVVTHWNADIVEPLKDGAIAMLTAHGVNEERLTVLYAPGAFELPLVAKTLADTGRYAAVIAIGAVIRGDTPHFEYVSEHCTHGLGRAGLDSGVPVIFGVLTVNTIEQARERSVTGPGNKGAEAAASALAMAALMKQIAAEAEA